MDRLKISGNADEELQSVLDALDCGVVKIVFDGDMKRRVLWANKGFYALTGSTKEDYEAEESSGNPRNVLHPDDMGWVFRAFNEHVHRRDSLDIQYRVFHRNGSVVWLHVKSTYIGQLDSFPVFINVMVDVTEQKRLQENLEWERKRYILASSLSEEILFEYSVDSDTLHNFGNYRNILGERSVIKNFRQNLSTNNTVYKDDIHIVEDIFSACNADVDRKNHITDKFRVLHADGEYQWYYAVYSSIRTEDGGRISLIGKIVNIHSTILKMEKLRQQARTDGMTGLLNKPATEETVQKVFAARPDMCHALFIADMDDFKGINDSFGHARGDEAIRAVALAMRDSFRDIDILGRIGGDEFLILIKDMRDVESASREAARAYGRLCGALRKRRLSLSAGLALYPLHGRTYADVFAAADSALYAAKKQGKGALVIAGKDDGAA